MGITLVCAALCILLLVAWFATRHRTSFYTYQPKFVEIHRGNVVLMSSIWSGGLSSKGWMYDVFFVSKPSFHPTYFRIGQSYLGTPAFNTRLYGLFIPIWNIAIVPGLIAIFAGRRARKLWHIAMAHGCPKCGYSSEGLVTEDSNTAVCPECGTQIAV